MNVWILALLLSLLWGGNSFCMRASRVDFHGYPPRRSLAPLGRTLPTLPESIVGDDDDELKEVKNGPDEHGNFSSLSDIYDYLKENSSYRGEGEVVRAGCRFRFRVIDYLGKVCVSVGS